MKDRTMVIKKSDIIAVLILLFPVLSLFGDGLFSYYDELLGAIGSIYAIWLWCNKRLYKREIITIFVLALLTLLGLSANVFFGVQDSVFAILVDVVLLWKMYACFIMFRHLVKGERERNAVLEKLSVFSKAIIVINVILCLLQQLVDIGCGMYSSNGGLKKIWIFNHYGFYWHNGIQTGWLIMICLLILSGSSISESKYKKYLFLSMIPLLFTFSSLVYGLVFILIFLSWILKEKTTFKAWYIVIVIAGVVLFTLGDFVAYSSDNAPRMILIRNGIQLANEHFPLGTGFATYGSEMANRYYSNIYISLGWENTWAFGRTGMYLNDNYFASIVAQFGWGGFVLFLVALYELYRIFNRTLYEKRTRCVLLALIIGIVMVMVASGAAKTMMGVGVFSCMGLVSSLDRWKKQDVVSKVM